MNKTIIGIINIAIGILSGIYLLIQNGTIVIKYFVENHHYTESFESMMNIMMIALSMAIIIILITDIVMLKRQAKTIEKKNNNGYYLCIGGNLTLTITLALMGSSNIFCVLPIIGGLLLIIKK